MGNGQNIIDKILADANAEAKTILDTAKSEADSILEVAKAKADKEANALEALSKAEAEKAAAKEISAAEMKAKKMILTKKQEILEDVIACAKNKLKDLTEIEYKVILLDMIRNANVDSNSEVILSKKDYDAYHKDILGEKIKVSNEVREIEGGFVIKKGDIEYNYSFNSIIAVEKEEIERVAAQILFG